MNTVMEPVWGMSADSIPDLKGGTKATTKKEKRWVEIPRHGMM